jgi:hypothetical protein
MNLIVKLISSPWFLLELILASIGGLVVFWGLWIEKRAEALLPPETFKKDIFGDIVAKYKAEMERGWRWLMVGIAIEVLCALAMTMLSGLEVANSNERAANAISLAGEATNSAAKVALANAQLVASNIVSESNILVLRSTVAAMELQMQPRNINPTQKEKFTKAFQVSQKKPVWVACSNPSQETSHFAHQVRGMLDDAGLGVGEVPCPLGGANVASGGICNLLSAQIEDNSESTILILVKRSAIDPFPEIARSLFAAFKAAEIKVAFISADLQPGETVVLVAGKSGF